ncbi:MAG TPA: tetratricopeptide repeat protein [Oculatellaceae cyanobacterium]
MKTKIVLLTVLLVSSIVLPLAVVFLHLNSSLHQRSWEKARLEAQRNGAHGDSEQARNLYQLALEDAAQFPINAKLHAVTYREAADSFSDLADFTQAERYFDRCENLIKRSGDEGDKEWLALEFSCLSGYGRGLYQHGNSARAQELLSQALPLYQKLIAMDDRLPNDLILGDSVIHDVICLASIAADHGEDEKAKRYVGDAERLLTSFSVDTSSHELLNSLAQKYKVPIPDSSDLGGG